jgi:hypothetical protein
LASVARFFCLAFNFAAFSLAALRVFSREGFAEIFPPGLAAAFTGLAVAAAAGLACTAFPLAALTAPGFSDADWPGAALTIKAGLVSA